MKQKFNSFCDVVKWHLWEMLKTLSNEDSFYSQKRMKAMVLFNSAMLAWWIYLFKHIDTMDVLEFTGLSSPIWLYAGFNVKQMYQEKREEKKAIIEEAKQ